MPVCVGVAFKRVAKSYWFDPGACDVAENDRVLVETARGPELGSVKIGPREVPDIDLQGPLKHVLRLATDADYRQERKNRDRARQALAICQACVRSHELPMKLLQAEYCFDATQITIYFAAETRVDFRGLVRDVAGQLRCKVQFHQVGARDQAKLIGGVGPCGLTLCCASFLTEFAPISMKMAKDQSLFLNPVKFSGVCGKLMCCLRYEHDPNGEVEPRLPQIGQIVMSPRGQAKVMDLDLQSEIAVIELLDGREEFHFPAAELRIEKTTKCTDCRGCSVNDLQSDEAEAVRAEEEPDIPVDRSPKGLSDARGLAQARAATMVLDHTADDEEPFNADL